MNDERSSTDSDQEASTSAMSLPAKADGSIRDNDVVCEKGRGDHERWPGNKLYRHLVSVNKESYNDRTPMERSEIIGTIIDTIKEGNGWFVQQSPQTGKWVDICEEKVRKKVSDDLRREVRRRREKRSNSTLFSARLKSLKGATNDKNGADDAVPAAVDDPKVGDVLFGPGARRHPGNKSYWDLMKRNLECYIISPYGARSMISRSIVDEVKSNGGRFLEQDPQTSEWYEIDDLRAIEKTSHALSNKKYKNRKKSPDPPNEGDEISLRPALLEVPQPNQPAENQRTSSTVSIESKFSELSSSSSPSVGQSDALLSDSHIDGPSDAKPSGEQIHNKSVSDTTGRDDDPSVAVRLLELKLLGQEVRTEVVDEHNAVEPTTSTLSSPSPVDMPIARTSPSSAYVDRRDDDDDDIQENEEADIYVQTPRPRRVGQYEYEPRDLRTDPRHNRNFSDYRNEEMIRSNYLEPIERVARNSFEDEVRYHLDDRCPYYHSEDQPHDAYYRTAAMASPMVPATAPVSRARLPPMEHDDVPSFATNLFPATPPVAAMRRNSWVQGGSYGDSVHEVMAYRRLGTERRMSAYAMLSKPTTQWSMPPSPSTHWRDSPAMGRRSSSGGAWSGVSGYDTSNLS